MPGSRRVKLIPRQNLLKIKIWDLQTPFNDTLYSVSLDPSMAYPNIVESNLGVYLLQESGFLKWDQNDFTADQADSPATYGFLANLRTVTTNMSGKVP